MKRTYVLFIVIIALQIHTKIFADSLEVNQDRDKIIKLYDQATMALEMGYTTDAISKLKEIIQMAPNFPETYLMLGNIYSKEQDNVESIGSSIELFKKYLRLKPTAQNANEVRTSINKMEFLLEKLEKEKSFKKNLQGRWLVPDLGTNLNSYFPLYSLILDIQEIGDKIQIKMEPSSLYYSSDLVSSITYPEIDDKGNWLFYFTCDKTYIPYHAPISSQADVSNQASYNLKQDLINITESSLSSGTSNPIARALISGGAAGARYSLDVQQAQAYQQAQARQAQDVQKNYKINYEFALKPNLNKTNEMAGVMRLLDVTTTPSGQKVNTDQLVECKLTKVRNDFVNLRPDQVPKKPNIEADKMKAEGERYYQEGERYYNEGFDKKFNQYTKMWGISTAGAGGILMGVSGIMWLQGKDSTDPEDIRFINDVLKPATFIGTGIIAIGIPIAIAGHKKDKKGDELMQKGDELKKKGKELQDKANKMYEPSIKSNKPTAELKLGVSGNGLALSLTF